MAEWHKSNNNVEILAQISDIKKEVLAETAASIIDASKEHKEALLEQVKLLETELRDRLDAEFVAREDLKEEVETQLERNAQVLERTKLFLQYRYEAFRKTLKRRQVSMAKCLVAELKNLSNKQLELVTSKSHELDKAQSEVKALLAEYKQFASDQYGKAQAQANSILIMAMNAEAMQKRINKRIKYAFIGMAIAQLILAGALIYGQF